MMIAWWSQPLGCRRVAIRSRLTYIYIQILKHRVKQRSYRHIIYDLLLGFSATSRYHMLVSCFCEKSSNKCLSSVPWHDMAGSRFHLGRPRRRAWKLSFAKSLLGGDLGGYLESINKEHHHILAIL